jgi:2-keto-4-pentenoate hydratase/2-oxohepta-3-ene-1,7-dioic acid hydratase in catechol pathway
MKIFCIGRNYAEHARELGNAVPDEPVVFMKPKNALLQNNVPFYYPEFTNELHYECELVLRVCKNGRYVPEKYARNYFDQISVGIDFTARDLQDKLKGKGLPWEKAKAFDQSAAVGKFVPINDIKDRSSIDFSFYKNKEMVQQGNSSQMIFTFEKIITNITQYFSINIGDLIFTGTPSGVGECLVGDELEACLGSECLLAVEVK